jgi:hypothetical protein
MSLRDQRPHSPVPVRPVPPMNWRAGRDLSRVHI